VEENFLGLEAPLVFDHPAVLQFSQGPVGIVWVARCGIWYVSAAHTKGDVSETLSRVERAFRAFCPEA